MQLKGVNRRIIEVNSADPLFEKAVLYVRPECTSFTEEQLSREAKEYVALFCESAHNRGMTRAGLFAAIAAAAAAGAFIAAAAVIFL